MLDGRVLEASQVEYKPFGKPPLQRELLRRSAFSGSATVESDLFADMTNEAAHAVRNFGSRKMPTAPKQDKQITHAHCFCNTTSAVTQSGVFLRLGFVESNLPLIQKSSISLTLARTSMGPTKF